MSKLKIIIDYSAMIWTFLSTLIKVKVLKYTTLTLTFKV
jgi:hypothetical protein